VRIPRIGVSAVVGSMGLNADRTEEVPTRPLEAGWYRGGPTPGQLGSAVILGHVDSKAGPAVFARLRSLHKGDTVDVTLANGAIAHFAVDRVATYPNADFPAKKVYGSHGVAALQLVTCGGRYDHVAKSYTANVVAYSSLVSTTPAPWLPAPRGLPVAAAA
jgi:sortase (surface protein transpeptidase)